MVASAMLVTGAIFYSCQKEQNNLPVKGQGTISLKDVSAGTYFTYSNSPICLGDPVTITFDNGLGNSCGNIQIQIWDPYLNSWVQVVGNTTPINGKASYTFTPDEARDYQFRGSWTRTGSPSGCPGTNTGWNEADPYLTVEVCGCETAFSGEAVSCDYSREANYTFTYDGELDYVKIQGGLTNWAGGDAVVHLNNEFIAFNGDGIGSVGDYTIKQWTPGGSSNRIISVEGPASCDPIVINITWNVTHLTDTITGDWTAEDSDGDSLGEVDELTCE